MSSREAGASASAGSAAAKVAVPVLFCADVLLGGSVREAYLVTAGLELVACLVLVWLLIDSGLEPIRRSAAWLIAIVSLGAVVCILQLVPLPFAWWSGLQGRAPVVAAFKLAGIGEVSQPLSLDPDRTFFGVLRLLPPVALFVLAARLPWSAMAAHLRWSVVLLAVLSAGLALAQTFAKNMPLLFPYGLESSGQAGGLFQVVNHQATLLLVAIPFIAVIFGRLKDQFSLGDAYQAEAVIAIAALMAVIIGVVISGSAAGYAMIIPTMLVSLFLVADGKPGAQLIAFGLIAAVGLATLAYLAISSPMLRGLGITDLGDGPLSRRAIYGETIEMARDYLPWGAGLGAYEGAYPAYEDAATVTTNFISHAHNDYLEIAAELGLPGCIALGGVIVWWLVMTVQAWLAKKEEGSRLRRAASVAVAVVLVHSLVDFPARTEAISCLAALCMGVMSSRPRAGRYAEQPAEHFQTFRHKHVEI